jgi:hypothetical protein
MRFFNGGQLEYHESWHERFLRKTYLVQLEMPLKSINLSGQPIPSSLIVMFSPKKTFKTIYIFLKMYQIHFYFLGIFVFFEFEQNSKYKDSWCIYFPTLSFSINNDGIIYKLSFIYQPNKSFFYYLKVCNPNISCCNNVGCLRSSNIFVLFPSVKMWRFLPDWINFFSWPQI